MEGRGGQKDPPTSSSPVASTNVGISPKNFLSFSFNSNQTGGPETASRGLFCFLTF